MIVSTGREPAGLLLLLLLHSAKRCTEPERGEQHPESCACVAVYTRRSCTCHSLSLKRQTRQKVAGHSQTSGTGRQRDTHARRQWRQQLILTLKASWVTTEAEGTDAKPGTTAAAAAAAATTTATRRTAGKLVSILFTDDHNRTLLFRIVFRTSVYYLTLLQRSIDVQLLRVLH